MKSHFLEKKNKNNPSQKLFFAHTHSVSCKCQNESFQEKKKEKEIINYCLYHLISLWCYPFSRVNLEKTHFEIIHLFLSQCQNKKYFYKNEHAWYLINKEAKWKYIKVYRCHCHQNGLIIIWEGHEALIRRTPFID